jgi:hypothetical protein
MLRVRRRRVEQQQGCYDRNADSGHAPSLQLVNSSGQKLSHANPPAT